MAKKKKKNAQVKPSHRYKKNRDHIRTPSSEPSTETSSMEQVKKEIAPSVLERTKAKTSVTTVHEQSPRRLTQLLSEKKSSHERRRRLLSDTVSLSSGEYHEKTLLAYRETVTPAQTHHLSYRMDYFQGAKIRTMDKGLREPAVTLGTYKTTDKMKKLLDVQYQQRLEQFAAASIQLIVLDVKISGNGLLTRVGHVTENGLKIHPTYGVPMVPGSSIKGAIRSWALRNLEGGADFVELLFGTGSDGEEAHRGIIEFDDLLFADASIQPDILTPHYQRYTSSGGEGEPTDSGSPIPVSFYRVKADRPAKLVVRFSRRFKSRLAKVGYDPELFSLYFPDVLKGALTHGLGAKTAVGYGSFTVEANRTQDYYDIREKKIGQAEEIARQKEIERLSPEERYLVEQQIELDELVMILQEGKQQDLDRVKAQTYLDELIEKRYTLVLQKWLEGFDTKQATKKLKERIKYVKEQLARLS
ncbi:hypothetical protein AS033_10170 [Exiguobacterium indicum]|uniref:CRISPR type III-associated protein domain-containing protein n=1 Tax=Exiguobacterium indicum TaxID=296995 RepID=A0A0V8GEI0_9BACL|nr:RAMP superfamily CRISPR-associated protein [Exiguobacterium enclense]KSU48688.1 hypothetical protein AS033_10170 [Exiguobacterium enclense]SDC80660.1 CRISPR type III-B/RAMP module RAMP protein Cmr6 [Exiguobacterium enclense]